MKIVIYGRRLVVKMTAKQSYTTVEKLETNIFLIKKKKILNVHVYCIGYIRDRKAM